MNKVTVVLIYAFLAIAAGVPADAADSLPVWAYPVNPPGITPAPDDGTLTHVPNSAAAYTLTQIRDLFTPPNWHPDNHPSMPDVVGRGNYPGPIACAYCPLPDMPGRPA